MTNKPMLSVDRNPVAWAVEISGCLKFFEQKKSAENARRRYEKVMDAERMEPFPLFAEQSAPVAVAHTMKSIMEAVEASRCYTVLTSDQCHALAQSLNGVKP